MCLRNRTRYASTPSIRQIRQHKPGDDKLNNVDRVKRRHVSLALVLGSLIASASAPFAYLNEDQIPKPQRPIEECRKLNDKKACLKASWAEYKNAILAEYEEW